jgi:cysteine synthase A
MGSHPIRADADFIPSAARGDDRRFDEIVPIDAPGIFGPDSSPGRLASLSAFRWINLAVARRIAEREPPGSVIPCILPIPVSYLSTPLFESIAADMNEELALSRSTPSSQLAAA